MLDLGAPAGVGEISSQVVQVGTVGSCQLGIRHHRLGVHRIGTGKIQCHGVEGGEHTHIRDDGHIVLAVAVAVGAHIPDQADVEMGTSVHHGLGILCDLIIQVQGGIVVICFDGLHGTHVQAAAAAVALVPVHKHFAVIVQIGGIMGADVMAGAAGHALLLVHHGAAGIVHILLAGPGTGAHAQVLQRTAEARFLMALEMVQRDDDIRIHDCPADKGFLHILAANHGNGYLVGALQTVGNEDVSAGGVGGKAVEIGSLDMVQRVLPGTDVEGVGIGQEGLAA